MRANAILKRLGFSPNDRAVIIHTDDIGMCEASVSAYAALHESGLKISGSTMVPVRGSHTRLRTVALALRTCAHFFITTCAINCISRVCRSSATAI